MTTFKISFETPNELTEEQFQSLTGSDIYAMMVINRVEVWVSSKTMFRVGSMIETAQNEVRDWLRKNCKGAFFLSTKTPLSASNSKRHAGTIYLANPDNAPTLKLFLHEKDIELPEDAGMAQGSGPRGPVGAQGPAGIPGPPVGANGPSGPTYQEIKDKLIYEQKKMEAESILDKVRRRKQMSIDEEERKKEEERLFRKLNLL